MIPSSERKRNWGSQVFNACPHGTTGINPVLNYQSLEGQWGQRPAGGALEPFYPEIKTGMLGHPTNLQRAYKDSQCSYSCDQIADVSACLDSAIGKNSIANSTELTTWLRHE